jgi:hypothetical protein
MVAATKQRIGKDLWLDATYKMRMEPGGESVKVMPLAKTLKMSRTSFAGIKKNMLHHPT